MAIWGDRHSRRQPLPAAGALDYTRKDSTMLSAAMLLYRKEKQNMADFRSFQAVRPVPDVASRVAALPYDVVSREEARKIGEKNPLSFLHIDRAEMDLPLETDLYDPAVYQRARKTLDEWKENGTFLKEEKPCYYIYEQTRLGKTQTGLVGCSSIDDYLNGVIKKHELTRADKEEDRIRHVDVCDANTGPIFLAARYPESLKECLSSCKSAKAPVYDFTSEDGISHRVWVIDDDAAIAFIRSSFENISDIYIADGHHRAASAVKVGQKRRQEKPDYTGKEEFNAFLSVVFPYDELTILAYNRVVADLNGLSAKAFLEAVSFVCQVEETDEEGAKPSKKHEIGLYVDGKWYRLTPWEDTYKSCDVVGQLDVSILQERILSPILDIADPRTNSRIRFVGGNQPLSELKRLADETGGVSFALYATAMEDLMRIADEGKLMPPKSTWFEPKLRSGLFIHDLR